MANHFFKFKQFTVFHDLCAMKVGTDGVLLGAWCDCADKKRILDVGTGTGLISLMVAQRNQVARIEAVEIDPDAARQAAINFEASPWSERLNVFHSDFIDFSAESSPKYDLIVSNPPYFENSLKTVCDKRAKARHTDSLSFDALIASCVRILAPNGILSLIYPVEADIRIRQLTGSYEMKCVRRIAVKGNPDASPKRILAEYTFGAVCESCPEEQLTIEMDRHQYTSQYISLTKDFYLKM